MSEVISIRTLDEQVRKMHRKFDKLIDTQESFKTARLEAALLLQDIRRRVEDGEAGDENAVEWWKWYADNFRQRSRADAEKLLAIANTENPQITYEQHNIRNTENQRAYRARQEVQTSKVAYPRLLSGKNTQDNSTTKQKVVVVSEPPKPVVNHAKVEAIIRQFLALSFAERSFFATRLRQVFNRDVD